MNNLIDFALTQYSLMTAYDANVNIDLGGTKPQPEPKLTVLWHPMRPNFHENMWDVTNENCSIMLYFE